MGWPKGQPRSPNSGRKKGTRNRETQSAQDLADSLGVDPFKILLHYANKDYVALKLSPTRTAYNAKGLPYEEDSIPNELAQKSAKDATPYLRPTLKAVEHSKPGESAFFESFADVVEGLVREDLGITEDEPKE